MKQDHQRLCICLLVSFFFHLGAFALAGIWSDAQQSDARYVHGVVLFQHGDVSRALLAAPVVQEVPINSRRQSVVAVENQETQAATENRPDSGVDTSETEIPANEGRQAYLPETGRYYKTSELTRKPALSADVQLQYPTSKGVALTGKVILRLLINETGYVDEVVMEASELPEEYQNSAVSSFSTAVFAPGVIGDTPVKSQLRIEVSYESDP